MHKTEIFGISGDAKANEKKVSELNQNLQKMGLEFKISSEEFDGKVYYYLTIKYDTDELNRKLTRNAGARPKFLNEEVPVSEIRRRMETESADNVAGSLGISRSTLFRKLKEAEKFGWEYIR